MVAHDNIHIPRESFPNWIWYAIEAVIVIVISFAIAYQVADSFEVTPEIGNWILTGTFGACFLVWYIGIRHLILKKKILRNKY
ncbi:MAG: hypothetical protein R3237_05550 [Nitrosopumilaceae archaeon]|nr:hypothetical protein [Nitrosopumilaceae archaeon]